MKVKIIIVPENITEKTFLKYISNLGFKGIKLTQKNRKKIINIIRNKEKVYRKSWLIFNEFITFDLKIPENRLIGGIGGKPDFIIYNKNKFYFCEFKSKSDGLRTNQILWIENHKDLPIAVAIAVKDFKI